MVSLKTRRDSARYWRQRFKDLIVRIYQATDYDSGCGEVEVRDQIAFSLAMGEWREQVQPRLRVSDHWHLVCWLLETQFDEVFSPSLIWQTPYPS